jgi:type IV secretory pathway VirB9-like protein
MSSKLIALALIAIATLPIAAQKIESESGDRNRIVHLETALNHLTIIEVSEPVTMVAAGSPSFKVEWKENKVFVQPTEPDVATNLFIWTTTERLNYELEPAAAVDKMDFAIDETPRIT